MAHHLATDYCYGNAHLTWSNHYLWPVLRRIVKARDGAERRVFEIGCGNGAIANQLSTLGFSVAGIDLSESGIAVAHHQAYPHLRVAVGDAYNDLAGQYGTFPLVVSLEVIEHCFYPAPICPNVF